MAAHRFRLELAGETVYGIAFPSESELEAFCAARGLETVRPVTSPANHPYERPPGRPSFDSVIAAAVAELKLDNRASLSDRARLVLRYLAQSHAAENIPCRRTVTRYLIAQCAGQRDGQNRGHKAGRARMRRSGGT